MQHVQVNHYRRTEVSYFWYHWKWKETINIDILTRPTMASRWPANKSLRVLLSHRSNNLPFLLLSGVNRKRLSKSLQMKRAKITISIICINITVLFMGVSVTKNTLNNNQEVHPHHDKEFQWKLFSLIIMINMFNLMMIRGPFPPGFPGLRLPGLRFHPHFGEAKVLKKKTNSSIIITSCLFPVFGTFLLTGWWPVSSGTTTLCSSSWRPGRKIYFLVFVV